MVEIGLIQPMNILIPAGKTVKHDVMRTLAQEVPKDQYGLPKFIYRTDMIPPDLYANYIDPSERTMHQRNASVSVIYDEGFPTLETGNPFWHQFPWEPNAAYELFHRYVMMPDNESGETPIRILSTFATLQGVGLEVITKYFHQYWWKHRAQAHDLFIVAMTNRLTAKRVMSMNDKHYVHATSFIDKCTKYLSGELDKLLNPVVGSEPSALEPRDVIKLQGMMMTAQRVALGQPANGFSGAQSERVRGTESVEVLLRQNNEPNVGSQTDKQGGAMDIRALLADPSVVASAQEIVIKMTKTMEGNRDRVGEHWADRFHEDDISGPGTSDDD